MQAGTRIPCAAARAAILWLALVPTAASAVEGEYPRERHSVLNEIRARPLSELGQDAIRFSTEPAPGGPATVVEVRPDRNARYRVTVSYLGGHPESGWEKLGAFHFWIDAEDFAWLLGEVERARQELGAEHPGATADGEIIVCTDGPGYVSEVRSSGVSRWIGGFCGRNANNAIAPLMARLVRFGTSIMLRDMRDEGFVALRPEPSTP